VGGTEEQTLFEAAKTTPKAQRTGERDGRDEEELPETPTSRALAKKDTPRRGILYSSPSKRPPRQKSAPKESQLKSNDQNPPELEETAKEAAENAEVRAGAEQDKEPDPLLEKKLEKERLLRVVEDLEEEVEEYAQLLRKEQERGSNDITDTEDLDDLVDAINKADTSTAVAEEHEGRSLSNLLASFLPFSRPGPQTPITQTTPEKPIPSHRPLELEDPLPYLQMFTSFAFTSSLSLPDKRTTDPSHGYQTHTIEIVGPAKLLTSTVVMSIDTLNHQITDIQIPRLSSWAGRDLGKYVRGRAKEHDIGPLCWAFRSYWDIAKRRAEYFSRCEDEFTHLLLDQQNGTNDGASTTKEKRLRKRKGAAQATDHPEDDEEVSEVQDGGNEVHGHGTGLLRRELHRQLGRDILLLQSKEVMFQVSWRIVFDWTGEAESEVEASAAVPRVWSEADDRNAFRKVPAAFDALVRERGVFEATGVMVALLFMTK
jgi:hypothetical protein